MFFFDPLYMILMLVCIALSGWAAAKTRRTFHRFSRVGTGRGLTGAEVARKILMDNGIHDVEIEPVRGTLSDHYDPRHKVLRLSEPVYGSKSISAVGVAAHEVGHAIQHAQGYAPLKFRSWWVPMAGGGTKLGLIVIIIAFVMGGAHASGAGLILAWIGIGLFACSTLFTLITLPVEFDASSRALVTLEGGGYLSPDELAGARKVLSAAAMTYVAAFVSSLLMLLYWAARLGLLGGNRD